MKKFYKLKFTLLTPFFYWSKISPGAVFTDEFIGDLALYYAINRIQNIKDVSTSFFGKFNPNYDEIKDFGFWISCARPVDIQRSELYAHKTEFKAEVINHTPKLDEKAGKSPYKGYFKQQGINPLSTFEAIIYCEKELIPPTIRTGTHLHTLVQIDIDEMIDYSNPVQINLFSWQQIYKLKTDINNGSIEYKLPIYVIYDTHLTKEIKDEIIKIFN